jgi:16S rRNA (guanine966-N2)-methyltransferase
MRVIAGRHGGRRLQAPAGDATRPTADRVREALFSVLGARVEGARVLDLFAGSGALGIEALSRGARHCTFVERDRHALDALRENLRRCGLAEDRAGVVVGDGASCAGDWDLALLDPPYAFEDWSGLLDVLAPTVAVCESGSSIDVPDGWVVVREKAYGATVVAILRHEPPPEQEDPA